MNEKNIEGQNGQIELTSFFSINDVVVRDERMSLFNSIRLLTHHLAQNHIFDLKADDLTNAVLQRERESSTIIGEGLALPHARIKGLEKPYLAIGNFPNGVAFTDDGQFVTLVILLLIPESQPARYLQILRAITQLFGVSGAVATIAKMTTSEEIMGFFRRGEMKLPDYICAGDLMSTRFPVINETEPLANAFTLFMEQNVVELPVTNAEGDLIGILNVRSMLRKLVPAGFRKWQRHPPAATLQVLAEEIEACKDVSAGENIDKDFLAVQIDLPARDIAIKLSESAETICYVLQGKELVGIITIGRFFSRILKD